MVYFTYLKGYQKLIDTYHQPYGVIIFRVAIVLVDDVIYVPKQPIKC